ncbi:MAG: hypothetical protein IBX57_00480 [Gammaproteobacteria bacterium]|nr:hypothetical protein [Gammaproteobacteria bacterium]
MNPTIPGVSLSEIDQGVEMIPYVVNPDPYLGRKYGSYKSNPSIDDRPSKSHLEKRKAKRKSQKQARRRNR